MSDLSPSPEDLTAEDQQALLTGNITMVEQVGDEWRDDHIDCVAIRVHVDGRQINTSLWWCGPVIIWAMKYADESPRAMADVLRELRNHVTNDLECAWTVVPSTEETYNEQMYREMHEDHE